MKTKITMKDIAREAGVSVATVSYVLNNKTEERISEDTRKKVLQIVNLLNYTPNQSAKALATSRSHNIAVYIPDGVSALKRAEQLHFLNALAAVLQQSGYSLIHLNPRQQGQVDNADAILCYDISEADFHRIGDQNFVPLLAVDSLINDPLFFQITTDFNRLRRQAADFFGSAGYTVACLDILNSATQKRLEEIFPSVSYIRGLHDLAPLTGRNVLVFEQTLSELLSASCRICCLPSITTEKLEKVMECVQLAVGRFQIAEHDLTV